MKKLVYIILLSLFFMSCNNETPKIEISFLQNDKLVKPLNGIIKLNKTPFDIIFKTSQPFDVLVNASFRDSLFRLTTNPEPLTLHPLFKANATIAEVLFNEEEGIYVSNEATSVWYYSDETDHKFNAIEAQGESKNYKRTIKNINDIDVQNNIEIQDVNTSIYLVFVSVKILDNRISNLEELQRLALKIEWNETGNISEETSQNNSFNDIASRIQTRKLPLIELTNFDSIIEEPYFFTEQEIKTLQLEKIYPNYYTEGYNYRTTPSYRINLSGDYNSLVFTTYMGDNEMETILINYDQVGNIIDHQVIAYDEIAESMFSTQSKITKSKLIINQIVWEQEPQIKQVTCKILESGIIDGLVSKVLNDNISNIPIILIALEELQLNLLNIKTELMVSKEHPDNPDDIIVVIPEIVEEEDQYYEYNSHILIINGRSGEVMHMFFESVKTNGWTSDAIMLKDIKIDTVAYLVSKNKRAFGVRVNYYESSYANPYENETLSLFVKSERDSLVKILNRYDVLDYGGESYGDCSGEFIRIENILAPSKSMTNNYFDILVNRKTTEIKNVIDENGDCDSVDEVSSSKIILKFDGLNYKQ